MSAFHNNPDGERMAMSAHKSMKWASGVSAVGALIMFGLSVASVMWHAKGESDHRENLRKLQA